MTLTPSLNSSDLTDYVCHQLNAFFPDKAEVRASALAPYLERALGRLEFCLSRIEKKYYCQDSVTAFNHLNTDQYATFLYFLGNTIYREEGDPSFAEKAYCLNKSLHGLDLFYEVAMPDIFLLVHSVGTVIGRGTFQDYLCVYQGCTIGGNFSPEYPSFGRGVALFEKSSVFGNSRIGANTMISAGAKVIDGAVPENSLVFGASPDLNVVANKRNTIQSLFGNESGVA